MLPLLGDTEYSEILVGGTVTFTVNLPPGVPMSSVALASDSTIQMGNRVTVQTDGAPNTQSAIVNAGTGQTSVSTDAVLKSDIWSRGGVFLGARTNVAGDVTTSGTLTRQSGVVIGGAVAENQSLTAVPTSWTVTFPSSSTNVILQPGQTATRNPGAFATVSVATDATLTLTSGTYFIDSLSTEPNGRILLTGPGPFVLNVRSSFMAKGAIVPPAGAPPLVVNMAGTSDVFLQAPFDGTLAAPNAKIILGQIGTSSYKGSFLGRALDIQGDVKIVHRGTVGPAVVPIAECVVPEGDGTFRAVFGYQSASVLGNITIPVGTNNGFSPGAANRGQPTIFKPGRQRAQFGVPFDGKALTWSLGGVATTANAMLPVCTPACVQHIVDPTKPRIDTVLTTPAAPLSQGESSVLRDTFRWQDTLPVPELLPNGDARIYYGMIYLSSRASVQLLDALRIHYSTVPLFESDMTSLESQGIEQEFFYEHDGKGQFVYAMMPGVAYNQLREVANDPVEPTDLVRALPMREIPANDSGIPTRTSCGLAPIAQCVAQASNGSLRAVFSYDNPAGSPVTVPAGADNAVTGGPATLPPEAFAAGRHNAVFAVPMPTGATIRWTLNGASVTLNAASPRCTPAMVAQIGVDVFNPFPPAAPTSCRYPTPGEVRHPASRLPPAARFNSCQSVSYSFAGTLGMKWRGVDDDAQDAAGLAADAALDLGEDLLEGPPSAASSDGIEVRRSPLFGKIIRKAVRKVAGAIKGGVDLIRRGLRGVAGLFLGEADVEFTIDPHNTDSDFPGTMQQAWGSAYGKAVSLQGIQLRANRSVFLSVKDLNDQNKATVKILRHLDGARLCFKHENGAGVIIPGLVPVETCLSSRAQPSPTQQTKAVVGRHLNLSAQMTDVHRYLDSVGAVHTKKAEVVTGLPANAIGLLNGNRPFAPCFAFSWLNDVPTFMTVLGGVAGDQLNQLIDPWIRAGSNAVMNGINQAVPRLTEAAANAVTVAAQLANTQLAGLANATSDAIQAAVNASQEARRQATLLAQAAEDYANAIQTAADRRLQNHPAAQAAAAAAQRAADELNVRTQEAQAAIMAAETAAGVARELIDQLAAALPTNDQIRATVDLMRHLTNLAVEQVTNVIRIAVDVTIKFKNVYVIGVGAWIGAWIGRTIGEYFELLAGGDIIFPGDANMSDRAVMTHEYGHYTLCNLLEQISPAKFALVYGEAAAAGLITNQAPGATGAVMNEAFADFIASQVVGATNYVFWNTSERDSNNNGSYCLITPLDPTATRACPDENHTDANSGGMDFNEKVRRNVSLFTDAFDGIPGGAAGKINRPGNGKPWLTARPYTLASDPPGTDPPVAGPGASDGDEVINLPGQGYRAWIANAMNRGTLLREENVFGGLSDAMTSQCDNWCARCEVFWLHTVNQTTGVRTCPTEWVGGRPNVVTEAYNGPVICTFDPPEPGHDCPTGFTPDPSSRVCMPACPPGFRFDSCSLRCVPDGPPR